MFTIHYDLIYNVVDNKLKVTMPNTLNYIYNVSQSCDLCVPIKVIYTTL